MDLALVESPNCEKAHAFNLLSGENYESTLRKSVQELVDQYDKGVSDFTAYKSSFSELLQARVDPPLEAIWVFSALSFHSLKSEKGEPLDRISTIKDLFQFFSACSASCNGSKSIALLAPVIFEVHAVVTEIWGKDLSLKRERKVVREIESLVESILGFFNVCSCRDSNWEADGSIALVSSLVNLARIWGNGETVESLKFMFPLVSDDICARLSEREELDIGYLAGVVVLEVFLLQLCLKFRAGVPRSELQKDLRTWAVGSVTGFQSYYFFDILVGMLLEPKLPVTSLLNSDDELLLRKIIYDTVILVEYSYLKPERVIEVPAKLMRRLAVTRLMVTHEAIEYFRENRDQTKAVSYTNAFSSSSLPSQLIKWATNQLSKEAQETRPNGSSPKALIKWLVDLESQGIRIFDDNILKSRAKLSIDISTANEEGRKVGSDLAFFIDNKGEQIDVDREEDENADESMSAAFVAASHVMKEENGRARKRKVGKSVEKKKQVKFLKYNLHSNSNHGRDSYSLARVTDGSSSGSDVEDPGIQSDDEMGEREQ